MFDKLFDEIKKSNPELLMIGVWGKDGLELERRIWNSLELDLELLGAQLADVVAKMDGVRLFSGQYDLEYVTNRLKVLVVSLSPQYFLLAVAGEALISGKLKFYLNLNKKSLLALL